MKALIYLFEKDLGVEPEIPILALFLEGLTFGYALRPIFEKKLMLLSVEVCIWRAYIRYFTVFAVTLQ